MTEIINLHHCSFCRKPVGRCAYVIAGPGVDICDECVDMCAEIITHKRAENTPDAPEGE